MGRDLDQFEAPALAALDNQTHRGARKPRPMCGCGPWIRPPIVRLGAGPSVIACLQGVRHLTDRPTLSGATDTAPVVQPPCGRRREVVDETPGSCPSPKTVDGRGEPL